MIKTSLDIQIVLELNAFRIVSMAKTQNILPVSVPFVLSPSKIDQLVVMEVET